MWIESDPEFHYWVVSGHLKLYDMGRVGSGQENSAVCHYCSIMIRFKFVFTS